MPESGVSLKSAVAPLCGRVVFQYYASRLGRLDRRLGRAYGERNRCAAPEQAPLPILASGGLRAAARRCHRPWLGPHGRPLAPRGPGGPATPRMPPQDRGAAREPPTHRRPGRRNPTARLPDDKPFAPAGRAVGSASRAPATAARPCAARRVDSSAAARGARAARPGRRAARRRLGAAGLRAARPGSRARSASWAPARRCSRSCRSRRATSSA